MHGFCVPGADTCSSIDAIATSLCAQHTPLFKLIGGLPSFVATVGRYPGAFIPGLYAPVYINYQ